MVFVSRIREHNHVGKHVVSHGSREAVNISSTCGHVRNQERKNSRLVAFTADLWLAEREYLCDNLPLYGSRTLEDTDERSVSLWKCYGGCHTSYKSECGHAGPSSALYKI